MTELLRGELLEREQQLENSQVETLVTQSLDLSLQESIKGRKKKWRAAFCLSAVLTALAVCGLYRMGLTTMEMKDNVLLFRNDAGVRGVVLLPCERDSADILR